MSYLRCVGVAKADHFARKAERLTGSVMLIEATRRFTGPGVLRCHIADRDSVMPLAIRCSEDALVDGVEYLAGYHEIDRLPSDFVPLYCKPGRSGRPIVDLNAWGAPDDRPDDYIDYRVAVIPYLLGDCLLLCLGEAPEEPVDWIILALGTHMGFDQSGQLKAIRFTHLKQDEIWFLERFDYGAMFRGLWTSIFRRQKK